MTNSGPLFKFFHHKTRQKQPSFLKVSSKRLQGNLEGSFSPEEF